MFWLQSPWALSCREVRPWQIAKSEIDINLQGLYAEYARQDLAHEQVKKGSSSSNSKCPTYCKLRPFAGCHLKCCERLQVGSGERIPLGAFLKWYPLGKTASTAIGHAPETNSKEAKNEWTTLRLAHTKRGDLHCIRYVSLLVVCGYLLQHSLMFPPPKTRNQNSTYTVLLFSGTRSYHGRWCRLNEKAHLWWCLKILWVDLYP